MDAHERAITTAQSNSEDTSNTNVIWNNNANIVNRGDHNRTHIGPDSRYNRGVVINAGSANLTVHGESSTEMLDKLRRAPAYYDSALRKQAQQCMQDTRVNILNTIYEWVDSLDKPPLFWLHGPAGTGKSTIAHTIAEECHKRGRLGASFFFAHANAECSDPNLLFSTIAYQLSKFDPDLRQHIADGVRAHPSPQDASIPTQLEEFILTPMRKLSNGPSREPIIVVIDAVDECIDPRKASEILQLLSAKIPSSLWLKFFITSRPEPEIRSILHPDIHRISRSFNLLRDVDASSTNEDIKRFLRFHLKGIGKQYELPLWPRETDVENLAQQAGGLFIFAHTAIEFIRDMDAMDPESQIAMLKSIDSDGNPAFNLNALYSRILQKAMPETATTIVQERVVTIIHAIVGLRAPLALCAIERLLELDCGVIRAALNQLRSIFIVPDNDEDTIQVIHPSFARYIADEESCTEKRFVVGGRKLHSQLAMYCLKQMKIHLKQNICNFKDFTTIEAPITDEKDLHSQTLSEELKYSCENFAAHVFFSDRQDGELCEMVTEWANHYLPYWLEVLALTGSFHNALPSLRLLSNFNNDISSTSHVKFSGTDGESSGYDYATPTQADNSDFRVKVYTSKIAQSKCPQSLLRYLPNWLKPVTVAPEQDPQMTDSSQLLADAIRMVSESYDDIKGFPYQIYASCLGFCPLNSPLFKQYSQLSTVRVLSGERKPWRPLLHAFKDPDGKVDGLTFSPNGTVLASSSSVGKIRLWDLETRENRVLACHTLRRDTAFKFSPDSKYIAADGNVYRVATGEEVLMPGISSAFSSDLQYIALGCTDGTIMLYDMQAPNLSLIGELSGHGSRVTTLAFSSDNKSLVSASWDHTIRVWNCSSREMTKQIYCRQPSGHVNFSANGTYVAAYYESFVRDKGFENYVWVADFQTGKEKFVKVLANHKRHYHRASAMTTTILSPSGNYIAFYDNEALYVVRWVAATQLSGTRLYREFGGGITTFSFTPDERSLLIGDRKGLIRSWRIPKYGGSAHRFDFECKAHFGAVQSITFSPNGKYFASASDDGSICVWNSTGVDLHEPDLIRTSNHPQTVTFAPDGQTIAINSGDSLSKIDAKTGHSIFHKNHYPVYFTIFSADGKYFASGGGKQELLFWDTGTTSCNWGRDVLAHAFSPDATHYGVLFFSGHLWIHDLCKGESREVVYTDRRATFWGLRFSHDSRHIVSFNDDICVFDVEKGVQTELNFPIKRSGNHCAFSPCDHHIAIAHKSGLDVLGFFAEEPNVREVHHQHGYATVEFSPDGQYILAAVTHKESEQNQLDLFHPNTLEKLYVIEIWSQRVYEAMREFRRTGRLLNQPLFQSSEYENFPYLVDKDGWVITALSKRLCRLPVANRGINYDVNGNRIVVVSPEGKVTLIQFGPNPVCIPTSP